MSATKIIIIGAGIGGLAAALALQRRGFVVAVYERATEIREVGAGLIVTANARRALADLGVDDALYDLSSCVPFMHTCEFASGKVVKTVSNDDVEQMYGLATLQVHRADLHDLLLKAVRGNDPGCLHPRHEFASLDQGDLLAQRDPAVTVTFRNGHSDQGDAVIGADGNASAVRSLVFPGEMTRFNGQVAFRALIPDDAVPPAVREIGMGMYPGPARYLLHYPLRGGSIMNLIGCGRSDEWTAEGWSVPASNEEFVDAYDDFAEPLLDLIHAIPEGALFKWGLRDREPLESWVKGRVAMLGDAAHPMTPFLGQGACMAVEDGLLLGRSFAASGTVPEALQRYEAARRTRGTNVQLWSREEGLALQDPMRQRHTAQSRGLLEYDPASVPV